MLTLILLCYIVGGCIMDALAFLPVSLPIFYPLVLSLGYDPIWFGQIITIVTTMGAIMPPIGICCHVVAAMASDIPLSTVFRGPSITSRPASRPSSSSRSFPMAR